MPDNTKSPPEKAAKLTFVPKAGTTKVVVNAPSEDKPVVVGEKGIEVDPGTPLALVLADHPSLKQD